MIIGTTRQGIDIDIEFDDTDEQFIEQIRKLEDLDQYDFRAACHAMMSRSSSRKDKEGVDYWAGRYRCFENFEAQLDTEQQTLGVVTSIDEVQFGRRLLKPFLQSW